VSDSVRTQRWQPTRLPRPWDSPGKNTGVGCHFLLQCMKVKSESEVAQSRLTPSDPMDCSLPGSSTHGIFQARVLEWGAIAFSVCIHINICMYVKYIHTCMYVNVYIGIMYYTHIHVYVRIYTHIYLYITVYISNVYMYTFVYISNVYMYTFLMCTCIHF